MINAKPRIRRLFRLRTILLVVMLSILFLPIGSLYFFRFYENELVRKTELELITQSAVLSAVYRELIGKNEVGKSGSYTPVEPLLDFSKQKTLPRRPDARDIVLGNQTTSKTEAQLAGKKMQTILQNTQKVTLAGMRILDAKGIVVAGRSELNQSLAHVKEVRRALNGHYTSVFRERVSDEPPPSIASLSRGTGVRVFTAFPIIDNDKVYGVVYLSRTPQNILKHLYGIKNRVVFLSLLLLGLTGIFVLFISSRISRPIRELIDQTQKVTSGELKTVNVLRQPGTYELAKLSNSFAEMSHTLHERSDYIQQFASHVSHEFKTPLTSMQGALELLLEHSDDMPAEQQQRFLENLKSDSSRLERLVNGLLEQARADSLSRSTTSCDLINILQRLKTRFSERELTIIFDEKLSELNVKIARQELETVFNNLFDNSLQHGASTIDIAIDSVSDRKCVTIRLKDNGSGISEANQKQIFTPFFTTRRDTGGTGLGLGIIQSILKASNGRVTHIASKEGAVFEVTLQRSID